MHTGSVAETILRMSQYGVTTRDIADSIVLIINQKLQKNVFVIRNSVKKVPDAS